MSLEAETEPMSDEDVVLADILEQRSQRRLLDREGIERTLGEMPHNQEEVYVAVLMINNIKDINGSYGEAAGDGAIAFLDEWVRATYPLESEVTFARLIGPRMVIADPHPQAGIHLRNLGELISTKQVPSFQFKSRDIELDVSLGGLRLKTKAVRKVQTINRAISASERAARTHTCVLIEDTTIESNMDSMAAARAILEHNSFIRELTCMDKYEEVIGLTISNITELQRQFGLITTQDWSLALGEAVRKSAPEECVLSQFAGWYFLAGKDLDDWEEVVKRIEQIWQMESANPNLEITAGYAKGTDLLKFHDPLGHLVSQALSECAHLIRTPELPFPYAGMRHLYRTRIQTKSRLDIRINALEMAFRFLAATFFGVLSARSWTETIESLRPYKDRKISLGTWHELALKLGNRLDDRDNLKGAAIELAKINKSIDLGGLARVRNEVSHRTSQPDHTYAKHEERVEAALSELDVLFSDYFSDYAMFSVVDAVWDGDIYTCKIRKLDGDSEHFPLDTLKTKSPLLSGWCYLKAKENTFFCLAPFFFIGDCSTCGPEMFYLDYFGDADQLKGIGVISAHEKPVQLPANRQFPW